MTNKMPSQSVFYLASVILAGCLLYLLAPVLIPFIVAALLAYLGDPVTDKLEARKIPRTAAVGIVFFIMSLSALLLLLILVPLLQDQLNTLFTRIPGMINWLQSELVPKIAERIGMDANAIHLDLVKEAIMANWRDVGSIVSFVLGKVSHSGQAILVWGTYIVLIPVVTFYLLRDWDILVAKVHDLIPRSYAGVMTKLLKQCDSVLAQFLRGQLLVMSALGFIYSIGLWIAGIEFALLIGMLAGLVSFVPYLGAIVGVAVAVIVAFMQYQDILHIVYVAVVFGIGQSIEGMILSPLLVGDRIGLHPVAVIFAVMAGGQLFGFVGILLALPVAAVVMVLLRYLHEQYVNSELYSP